MKEKMPPVLLGIILLFLCPLRAEETFPVRFDRNRAVVKVQYRTRLPGSKTWTARQTSLTGAGTESMMRNQLLRQHPGCEVRILAAKINQDIPVEVRYQLRKNNASWVSGTTVLRNALTESMARNQLTARYSDAEVRILSMIFKRDPAALSDKNR